MELRMIENRANASRVLQLILGGSFRSPARLIGLPNFPLEHFNLLVTNSNVARSCFEHAIRWNDVSEKEIQSNFLLIAGPG
jgi:hypothetical protein